mmetsp:Transcript_31025/g.45409  ORF Transcript_31025/g.45409 Transcript_31025/m.45409 type:complete len:139 (-) Transcript_31025:436-852(-)
MVTTWVILGKVIGVKIVPSGTNRVPVPRRPKTEYSYLVRFDDNAEEWFPATKTLMDMLAERENHEEPSLVAHQFTRTPPPGPTTPRLAYLDRVQRVQTTGHDFVSRGLNYDSEDSVEFLGLRKRTVTPSPYEEEESSY